MGGLGFPQMGPTPILTGLTGVQEMVILPAVRCHTKHIEVQYHYVRDHVAQNRFVQRRVDTSENAAYLAPSASRPHEMRGPYGLVRTQLNRFRSIGDYCKA